jgi:hypothetical protein
MKQLSQRGSLHPRRLGKDKAMLHRTTRLTTQQVKTSPTFVARFADGQVTRMTTWHDPERKTLDLVRAVKLARHAYRSRTKCEPPAIVKGHFENGDGTVLTNYTAKQLAEAVS